MFSGPLSLVFARERTRGLRDAAVRGRRADDGRTPAGRITLRCSSAADASRLRILAELDSAPVPTGPVLLAEVDGQLRAALPFDGTGPIADPFHRGVELIELLRLRAVQLLRA